eukprot:g28614.t1
MPHTFTSAILTAVYIPTHAGVKIALDEIYTVTNILETKFPETLFIMAVENLDEYTITITDFTTKCVEDCVPKKSIQVFSNQKPWMNLEMHCLLKARHAAFKSDDPDIYRKSTYGLHKAIRDAKRQQRPKPTSMDSCCLCQGLNNIMGYKLKQSKVVDKGNAFYARFKQNANGAVSPTLTAGDTPVPSLVAADVRSFFLRVNPRKATGPDRVPSCALRSCVDQLVEAFTNIFNLAPLQAEVPTCFEKSTVIPVPKKYPIPKANQSLTNFYRCTIESILFACIMAWYGNCSAQDLKKLQKVVCTAQTITDANFPSMDSIYMSRC